mgnify:CR=1 FL=1
MSLGRRCRESRPVPWWRSGQGNVWEGVRSGNGGVYLKSSDFDEHGVFDPLLPDAPSGDENAPPGPSPVAAKLSAVKASPGAAEAQQPAEGTQECTQS